MIHLITAANRGCYAEELEALHRARYRHFVEERGWTLDHADGLERDVYDDDQAMHLVGFSAVGELEVSCRVRPTRHGGLIPDVFPHLISPREPDVRAPGVYECTRYFTASRLRGRAGFEARSQLHVALLELMEDLGGQWLLGFVDLPLLAHLRRFSGLRLRPVGLPAAYDEGGETVAFEIGVGAAELARTREKLAIPGRQLFVAPPWLPRVASPQDVARSLQVLLHGDAEQARELKRLAGELCAHTHPQQEPESVLSRLAAN